jgi:hypothetical protein
MRDFISFALACCFSFLFACMLLFLLYLLALFPCFIFLLYFLALFLSLSSYAPPNAPLLRTLILNVPLLLHSNSTFSYFLCYCASPQPLGYFSKLHPKFLSNRPPTLTCGLSRATQACCIAPFHDSINFCNVSLAVATSFFSSASLSNISSMAYCC